jgi:cell fate (sporulation/competence/biofilm development) regulator YmcA (YheA/YmcA/DUF963 family)
MASEVIVKRDLSRSLKSKYIDIPAMPITVSVTLDDKLRQMALSGKEGFRLQQLVDAANDAINKWTDNFQSAIDAVDKKLPELSAGEIKDKMAELNDVLQKYSKQLEAQVNREVDDNWKAITTRNKDLRNYKIVLGVKTAAVVLAAAGNIASLVATAGADVLSAVSLVNAAANLAAQFHRECMDLFKQHERLSEMMTALDDTVRSDLGGFKDIAKSIAGDVSPVLGRFLTSTKGAQVELKSLKMKFIGADKEADDTVGKINASLDKLAKIKKGGTNARAYALVPELEKQVDDLLKGMIVTRKVVDEAAKDLDEWAQALQAWNNRNPAKARLKQVSGLGKIGTTIAAAIAAVVKTASAVKTLVG